MGRGVSSGGGQSSLNYLFGSGEAPKPSPKDGEASLSDVQAVNHSPKLSTAPKSVDVSKQIPAGINSTAVSGQNTGNFLTVGPGSQAFYLCHANSELNEYYIKKRRNLTILKYYVI